MLFSEHAAMGAVFGLLIGSFLNVVIHRLPRIMEQQWADECAHFAQEQAQTAGQAPVPPGPAVQRISLSRPRSSCPHCGHAIRWYENIPVLSYLALRGKCSACKAGISPRYPLVEIATAALFAFCLGQWGPTATGLAWCGFSAALGAWFGWPALVPMILAASVIGAIVGLAMKFRKQLREGGYIPFGPFLAGAGLAAMLFGPQQMLDRFLRLLGL
ncbi:Leader peptidase PppA [compost metagenome]